MADLALGIKLTADDQASAEIAKLRAEMDQLRQELNAVKAQNEKLNESQPGFWTNMLDAVWKFVTGIAAAKVALADFGKMSDDEFLAYAETQIKAAQATGKTVDASLQAEAANRKLASSYTDLVNESAKSNEGFDTLTKTLTATKDAQEQLRQIQLSGASANAAVLQTQQAQAAVYGSTAEAVKASIAAQAQELLAAQQTAWAKRAIANDELDALNQMKAAQAAIAEQEYEKQQQGIISRVAALLDFKNLEDQKDATKALSDEQLKEIETLRQSAIQKSDAAVVAEEHVKKLQAEAQSTQGVIAQMEALATAATREIALQENTITAEQKVTEARKAEATERLKTAKDATQQQAIENEIEVTANQLTQQGIALADVAADKARAKSDAARAYAQGLQAQVDANEQATAADQHAATVAATVAAALEQETLAALRTAQSKRDAADQGEISSKAELIAAQKSVAAVEAQMTAVQRQSTIQEKSTQLALDMALAEGRKGDAIELATQKIIGQESANTKRAEILGQEIGKQQELIDKLEQYGAVVDGKVVPADAALIEAAKAKLGSMEEEKVQIDGLITHTAELAGARVTLLNAMKAEAQQALALAQAQGHEWEAKQRLIEIANIEVELAQLSAQRKTIEAQASVQVVKSIQDEIAAKQAVGEIISEVDSARLKAATTAMNVAAIEANAAGLVAEAEQKKAAAVALGDLQTKNAADGKNRDTQATEQNTEATQKNTEASGASVDMLKSLNDFLSSTRSSMDALSASARQYFEMMLTSSLAQHGMAEAWGAAHNAQIAFSDGMSADEKVIAGYRKEIVEAGEAIWAMDNQLINAFNGFQVWEDSIIKASAQTKIAFDTQAIAAENFKNQLTRIAETGTGDLYAIQAATRAVHDEFGLLDQQKLDALQAEIDKATSKLKAMQDAAQSAKDRIAELNAEIAAAKGDTATSDRLKLQLEQTQALAEVEANLAEARLQNNRELIALYETQKNQLQTLYDLKEKNLEQDIRTKAGETSGKAQTTTLPDTPGKSGSAINITVNASGARMLDKAFVEDLSRQLQPELSRLARMRA